MARRSYPKNPVAPNAGLNARIKRYGVLDPKTGCIIWTASVNHSGYGKIGYTFNGKKKFIGAHQAAWIVTNGPIPRGMFVCHKCDNPPCVNDNHLFLGSSLDNSRDSVRKGRNSKGISHGMVKLTERKIQEIRKVPKIYGSGIAPKIQSQCRYDQFN